jgi:hypothetical protein
VRKDSPKLLATINEFLKTHRQGTALGQQSIAKYTGSTYTFVIALIGKTVVESL